MSDRYVAAELKWPELPRRNVDGVLTWIEKTGTMKVGINHLGRRVFSDEVEFHCTCTNDVLVSNYVGEIDTTLTCEHVRLMLVTHGLPVSWKF